MGQEDKAQRDQTGVLRDLDKPLTTTHDVQISKGLYRNHSLDDRQGGRLGRGEQV